MTEAVFHPTLNDKLIRLAHLEAALGRAARWKVDRPGLCEQSVRAEIEYLRGAIRQTNDGSYDPQTKRWRW